MITYLKYVPHSQMLHHLASGWAFRDELHFTNHGEFSTLMIWTGDGEPQ